MASKLNKKATKKEKSMMKKASITDEDIRNSEVLRKQIERGKRRLKEIRFPTE